MAEPVIVPVQLEVTDVDVSNIDFGDASKQISKSLATVKKSIQDAFSGIDASAINKSIEKSMTAVEKTVQSAEIAYLRYREALISAGKSTEEYKADVNAASAAIRDQEQLVHELSKLGPAAAPHLAQAQKELDALIESRKQIDPLKYVDKAEPIQLEKVATAYKKVISAQEAVNKKSEEFNQTAKDNRTTDEYEAMIKEAESYKRKLAELNEKSKYMEKYGATDKQWEKARNDADWYSAKLDEVIKKLRESVKTGKALRFGDGPKVDLSRQVNSIAMSAGNQAGAVKSRARKNESPYTEDYQKALNELDKLEKKIESIREKSAKMLELGASGKQFESVVYDADQLDKKVIEARTHLTDMVNSGAAFKFGNGNASAEINKITDKSNSLQSSLANVVTNAKKSQGGLTALSATHPKLAAILTVTGKIATGFGKVLQVTGRVTSAIVKGFSGAIRVLGKVTSTIGRVASGLASVGKRLISAIRNIRLFGKSGNKASSDMGSRFKKLAKNFLMFGLGFRTAYYAIKRLRNIFIESFKLMGEQFDEVGKPMTKFMEAFNRLKGSLATAFQPIVSVVMPILTRFMNYLSGVFEAVGKFMATLTGQGYIYKAVAKNIDSVSSAAKEANNQLGSYDKLEVIQENDLGYDYEKQEIGATESAASSFAEMVKAAWENADFTGVGQFVTDKLLEVLDNVEKNIVPKVLSFVNKLLTSVNTFLEGFDATSIGTAVGSIVNAIVTGFDWAQLGELFANINNTVWGFLSGLFNSIDWATLGVSLSTGIMSVFNNLDFDSWAGMISGLTNGITDVLTGVFAEVKFDSIATTLGNAISNLFTKLKPKNIGEAINSAFESALKFVKSFFKTDAVKSVTTFITTLINTIDWNGVADSIIEAVQLVLQSVGTALAESDNPILSAFGSLVTTISTVVNILWPVIQALVSSISPIIQTIIPTIVDSLPPVAEILAEAVTMVLPVLVKLITTLLPILSNLTLALLPTVMDILKSLQPIFDALVDAVLPVVVHLLEVLVPLIVSVSKLVTSIMAPLFALIGPLIEIVFNILDPIITILEPVIKLITVLCDILGAILGPILEVLTPLMEALNMLFEALGPILEFLSVKFRLLVGVVTVVISIVGSIVALIRNIFIKVIEALANIIGMLGQTVNTVFSTIMTVVDKVASGIKKPINSIIGYIEIAVNSVIKGVNTIIKAINSLSFDVPDWVPGIGGQEFGFNLTSMKEITIPRLAQGAVIPPNKEFLAMLGDQKSGTNIEAPLDTIKQALAEVLAEVGGAGNKQPIILQVNGRTLAQVVWDEQEKRYKQTGKAMA